MLGCHDLLEPGDGPALIFDIGGGSTELVLIDTDGGEPRIDRLVERALGRRLADRERVAALATTASRARSRAYARMRERVRRRLSPTSPSCCRTRRDGIRAARHQRHGDDARQRPSRSAELRPARGRRADRAGRGDARHQRAAVGRWSIAERAEFPCIGHERADLVVAGCAILESDHRHLAGRALGVADRGIREGILRCADGRATRHEI